MDIVIADAELRRAAGSIETALYQLSSICERARPLVERLSEDEALKSAKIDEKYQSVLDEHLADLSQSTAAVKEGAVSDVLSHIESIDEIDSSLY